MDLMKQKIAPKSVQQLTELVKAVKTPFIIKGIICIDDALAAVEAGADVIVVSNHGGRITQNHPSAISALPAINKAVKNQAKIVLDGGVRNGEDIFKALAMGADAVMIGRPFATAIMGGGSEGIKVLVNNLKKELEKIMILTGSQTIKSIRKDLVNWDKY